MGGRSERAEGLAAPTRTASRPLQQPSITDRTRRPLQRTSLRLVVHTHTLPSLHSQRSSTDVPARLWSRQRQAPPSVALLIPHPAGCIRGASESVHGCAVTARHLLWESHVSQPAHASALGGSVSGRLRLLGDVCLGSGGATTAVMRRWSAAHASHLICRLFAALGCVSFEQLPASFFCTCEPSSAARLHISLAQNE